MKIYQRIGLEHPSIKRSEKISKDKYRAYANRHINKEIEVVVQDSIFTINYEYFLHKQRKHQNGRNNSRKRNRSKERLTISHRPIAAAILERH